MIFYVLSDDIPKAKEKLTNANLNSTYNIVYVGNGDATVPGTNTANFAYILFEYFLWQTFTLENLFTWISISGIDLALLSLSNHSIISYGSFSMWGALLATNEDHEVIMPKDYALTDVGERINMTNIPNWTFIWSKNCVTLLNTFRKCDNKII